jgi:serine/threonine-protein kinase
MAEPNPGRPEDSEAVWTRRERLISAFEDAWQSGTAPTLADFVPPAGPDRAAVLVELVHVDLEYRLKAGEAVRLETYLQRLPELADNAEAVVALLLREYELRRPRESGLSREEYLRRFPQYAAELERRWPPEGSQRDTVRLLPAEPATPPAGPPGAAAPTAPPGPGPRYRPVRFHARGGLGEVFVARDDELNREVALKRIQPRYRDHAESRRRFLVEAEVTARLEHPGVVPVHGLVHDASGQPCYAMRFVAGETLQDAIARFHSPQTPGLPAGGFDSLPFRQLLGRFVAVCNTVAYAHSRGVLHRDLKPTNILLGKYGETLVVDWGLAGSCPRGAGEAANGEEFLTPQAQGAGETRAGTVIGTPAYMSPEQAAGHWDAVGPASDVFSLGATLYQLFTGAPLYGGTTLDEALDRARRRRFVPPRQLKKQVPRPLEAVCLRALAKRPGDRYPSAAELAADVERWLAGEPAHAYPEPLAARLGRLVKRHRTLAAAVAAAVLVALGSLAVAAVFLEKARAAEKAAREYADAERLRAQAHFHKATEAVNKYLSEVTQDPRLKQSDLIALRRRLLESAAPFFQQLIDQEPGSSDVQAMRGRALERLALVHEDLGAYDRGIEMTSQALAVFEELHRADPGNPEYQYHIGKSHSNLGSFYSGKRQLAEAEAAYNKAREAFDALLRDHPDNLSGKFGKAAAVQGLAHVYMLRQQLGPAGPLFEESVRLQEDVVRQDAAPENQSSLALYCLNQSVYLNRARRIKEAEVACKRAVEVCEQLVSRDPESPEYQDRQATCLSTLGFLYLRMARRPLAEENFRRALKVQEGLVRRYPSAPTFQHELAITHHRLATLLMGSNLSGATAHCQKELELRDNLVRNYPAVAEYAAFFGGAQEQMGEAVRAAGNLPAAVDWFDKAVRTLEDARRQHGQYSQVAQGLTSAHWGRAETLGRLGRYREAVPDWDRAIELEAGVMRPWLRLQRALALARVGEHARATAEARELAAAAGHAAHALSALYTAARVYALSAVAVKEGRLAEDYATQAMALLSKAHAAGYFKARGAPGPAQLEKEFEPLRGRDDFQRLLEEIRKGAAPEPKH